MGRPERRLDPDAGPVERFACELRGLRRSAGGPSYRRMAADVNYSSSALSEAAGGRVFPSWDVTRAFVAACGGDEQDWAERWRRESTALSTRNGGSRSARIVAATSSLVSDAPSGGSIAYGHVTPEPRPRRRKRSRLAVLAFGLALVVAGVLAGLFIPAVVSPRVAGSTFLGEVDLDRYCRAHGYTNVTLNGTSAYDWHCGGSSAPASLSVIEACRQQYGAPQAVARYDDIHNPNSWQCWDHVLVLGRVDLDKYCQASGYGRSVLKGATVDTFACVSDQGRSATVDPDSACRWQYGARVLVANPGDYVRPWDKWDCWG